MNGFTLPRGIIVVLAAFVAVSPLACGKATREVPFKYMDIIKTEYKYNVGKAIPVTIDQSIEIDGTFTGDGAYFFFSSNRESGNYDIYLRNLADITTVRIIRHPAKDTAPAISPDGRRLAFVSQREDPEGDIFVAPIDPAAIIAAAKSSVDEIPPLDGASRNLTQFQDPQTGTIKIVRDASPAWSPDGTRIAFSSTRDGAENIWIMDASGANLRRITTKGGLYPSFSRDGKRIVFISYRDAGSRGNIYTVDVDSGTERQITKSSAIKLHPCFVANDREVIYTLIDRDTNGDGRIDLADNAVIAYQNLDTGAAYPLTLHSHSSFMPRWFPVFIDFEKSYRGVVLYSEQIGQNININVIPETGIIPRSANAEEQFNLALKYLREFDDYERYELALERVFHFFGSGKDARSVIFVTKALIEEARYALSRNNARKSRELAARLTSLSSDALDYRRIAGAYLSRLNERRPGEETLRGAIARLSARDPKSEFIPYVMEDLAAELMRVGNMAAAESTLRAIAAEHPKYRRAAAINYTLGSILFQSALDPLPQPLIQVLDTGSSFQKIDTALLLIKRYQAVRDPQRRIDAARRAIETHPGKKSLAGTMLYVIGLSRIEQGKLAEARTALSEALAQVSKFDLIFFRANVALGGIAERQGNANDAERFYSAAANNYLLSWNQPDIRTVIRKLIDHYEEHGERLERAGSWNAAVDLYKKYVWLVTYIHLNKRFEDLYNEYAPRAHVLYIDAHAAWKGNSAESLSALEKEYLARLPIARNDFDKAHIYGLGYIYARSAITNDARASSVLPGIASITGTRLPDLLAGLKRAVDQIEWALFIDDTFVDAYILNGWIFQYVDLLRREDASTAGGKNERVFARFFPKYLWERSIPLYEKALTTNDETANPEAEGNLHLNIANCYFLLNNYPKALTHYALTNRFKNRFNSPVEEALFRFHYAYCLWQNGDIANAREEMNSTLSIYRRLASGKNQRSYKHQILYLYRYFALFDRMEGKHASAIDWYQRIIDFAAENGIEIDRARYLQEIGHCYGELGDTDRAQRFLEQSQVILVDAPDRRQTHKIKWRVFGISFLVGQFEFFDLGPDVAVIGDNRLYSELDTYNKKLLNLSLFESYATGRADHAAAIGRLTEKLALLKKRDYRVNREAIVRTLNNIGYHHFMLRDYAASAEHFRAAWRSAADPKINDLDGMFRAVMNMVNLYAYRIENGRIADSAARTELDELARDIASYRAAYETGRLEAGLKQLEAAAKARREAVTERQRDALREKISTDAAAIYFSLDIAQGIVTFYRAELRYRAEFAGKEPPAAFDIYLHNRELYDLYADARSAFDAAVADTSRVRSREFAVKLLLNRAICQTRLAQYDEAADSYREAETIAEKFRLRSILWEARFQAAVFLARHGQQTGERNHIARAEDYFTRAAEQLERPPYRASANLDRVRAGIIAHARFLARRGLHERAFAATERLARIVRAHRFAASSLSFPSPKDAAAVSAYAKLHASIESDEHALTAFLEGGGDIKADRARALASSISEHERALADLRSRLDRANPHLSSCLFVQPVPVRAPAGSVVYAFLDNDDTLIAWTLAGAALRHAQVPLPQGQSSISDAVRSHITGDTANAHSRRFIILSDTSLAAYAGRTAPEMPAAMLIPALDRVSHALAADNAPISRGLVIGVDAARAIKGRTAFSALPFTALDSAAGDLPHSQLIFDDTADGLSPASIISRGLRPRVLIKRLRSTNYTDDLLFFSEAALYAGVRSLVVYTGLSTAEAADLAEATLSRPASEIASTAARRGAILAFGNPDKPGQAGADPQKSAADAFSRYTRSLESRRFDDAARYLTIWRDTAARDAATSARFHLLMADLAYRRGDLAAFGASIGQARTLTPKNTPDHARALGGAFLQECLSGNAVTARTIFDEYRARTNRPAGDGMDIMQALCALMEHAPERSLAAVRGLSAARITEPHAVRLLPVLLRFAELYGHRQLRASLIATMRSEPLRSALASSISDIDAIRMAAIPDADGIVPLPDDVRWLSSATDAATLRARAFEATAATTAYTVRTAPLLSASIRALLARYRFDEVSALIGRIRTGDMIAASHWMDALALLDTIRAIHTAYERRDEAIATVTASTTLLERIPIASLLADRLYDETVAHLARSDHARASASVNRALAITPDDADLKTRLRLLEIELMITQGSVEAANTRLSAIESTLPDDYRYDRSMLRSLIVRHGIIQAASQRQSAVTELLQTYDRLIADAMDALDATPGRVRTARRLALIEQGLDFSISYRLSARRLVDSLSLFEAKKQISFRARMSGELDPRAVPARARGSFRALTALQAGDPEDVRALLTEYPQLMVLSSVRHVPIAAFQGSLPADAVAIVVARSEADLYIWTLDRSDINAFRIRNGFVRMTKLIADYHELIRERRHPAVLSTALAAVFEPVEKHWRGRRTILFITDRNTEAIPYELIGRESILDETHAIAFAPSILAALREYPSVRPTVRLGSAGAPSLAANLDRIAIRESGITVDSGSRSTGFTHVEGLVAYHPLAGAVYVDSVPYRRALNASPGAYIASLSPLERQAGNDLALLGAIGGSSVTVITAAEARDVNAALFTDAFYREFSRSRDLVRASSRGRAALRADERYRHPAYWCGIRLYLSSNRHLSRGVK